MSIDDLTWLDPEDASAAFPQPAQALTDPEGLLAFGGDLSPARIMRAYQAGIFPWYAADQPILWWSPNPRGVLKPREFIAHRSLKRVINKPWQVSYDQAFEAVIRACAEPRADSDETWITEAMIQAYCQLHALGAAHSVEVWDREHLIGGVYGLALGSLFAGESMFSRQSGGSKIALLYLSAYLDQWHYTLIDTQLPSAHLTSLGGRAIERESFLLMLQTALSQRVTAQAWQPGQVINVRQWLANRQTPAVSSTKTD